MYKQMKGFTYLAITFFASAIIYWGCKKKDVYPSQVLPAITSLTPASAIVGTSVTIKGSNLKNTSVVKFGSVNAAAFSAAANTDTAITVKVPAGVPLGDLNVQVTLQDGGYSSTKFTVLETPRAPTITLVNPKKAFPEDEIAINGADMANVTEVKFGTVVTTSFTATMTKITVKVPANATGGDQLITITNPVGPATTSFTVDLSPVIISMDPVSGQVGDSVTVTGKRFTNITSVKVGTIDAGFRLINATALKLRVPVGATSNKITASNTIGTATSANPFDVKGLVAVLEPVQNASLVFFDFNGTGKDKYWNDVGDFENDAALGLPGSGRYWRVNTGASVTNWKAMFFRNGKNNFPGAAIGTNVNDYVLKFDIFVIDPITGGEFAWRLKGTEGDFFYAWKPWAATGSFRTFGWKTYTIPLSDFADGIKHIIDLNNITEDFGVAFNNGTATLNFAIDNVRFEHK